MKLLVLVNHYNPDRGGGGAVYTDMCRGLVERGHEVTVYCPYPFYPEWRDKSGKNGWRLWRYVESGVRLVRYGLFIPRNPRSLLQRLCFEISLLLSLLRLVPSARKYEGIMVYCPYFSAVVVAWLMKLLFNKPVWLNVQDIASAAAQSTGMVQSGILGHLFNALERYFFNAGDVWSSISPVMINTLAGMRSRKQPILFLPNWVDAELSGALSSLPTKSSVSAPLRLLYAGNIAGKQDLLRFCMALHATTNAFTFNIFGNGGASAELERWVQESGDERFSFGPFMDARDLAHKLKESDFYVITEKSGAGVSFFPSKYITSLVAGTPVLTVSDISSPLGDEVRTFSPGPLVPWNDLDNLSATLEEMSDESRSAIWRSNALARSQDFDRDVILDRLVLQLDSFLRREPVKVRSEMGELA